MVEDFETGELRQASLWFVTEDQRKKAESYLKAVFRSDVDEFGVIYGPVRFREPGDHGLIPPEIGAKLLIAEAQVLGFRGVTTEELAFLMDLDTKDLNILREITQKAYQRMNPGKPPLSIDRIDSMVGRIGQELAEKLLRENHAKLH